MKKIYFIYCFLIILNVQIIPGTVKIIFNDDFIIDCEFTFIPYCYGDQQECEITYFNSNGRWERYYCKVPLPEFLYQSKITNATLSIYKIEDSVSNSGSSFRLVINRLSEPMMEYYEHINDNNVFPPSHFASPVYAVSDSISGDFQGWIKFRIDTLVQGWLNNTYNNDGFLIRMNDEGDSTFYQRIIICESSFEDAAKRPILTITGPQLPDTLVEQLPTSVQFKFNGIEQYTLEQNYPNPFNPTTKIEYSIPKTSFVTLKVYDMLGREVATLVNEDKSVGIYTVNFDGSNLSSGIYFYQLKSGSFFETKKLILLR